MTGPALRPRRLVQIPGWYFPDSLGGTEVYVAGLCRRLHAGGCDVWVAAPRVGGPDAEEYEHNGVPVFRYQIPREPTRAECQGRVAVRGTERLHRWLREFRPDIVHVHTFSTGIGLREVRAAREVGARVVTTIHLPSLGFLCHRGTMLRWGEHLCDGICRPAKCAACVLQERGLAKPLARVTGAVPGASSQFLGLLPGKAGTLLGANAMIRRNLRMQEELFREADAVVVLTAWARDALIRNGAPPEKIVLNRLGHGHAHAVRKPSPDTAPSRRPVRLGFVGRLSPLKGADILARAVTGLPSDVAFSLEICGPSNGEGGRAVEREIRTILARDPRVTWRGAVPPEQVPELIASYDALVVPSVCLEGGPTVAIEAHAVGTPVVGSRIGGLAELVENGVSGRLVEPGDVAALAGVIRAMSERPEETIDRWRTALPPARTMDEIACEYSALYDTLLRTAAA